MKNKFQIIRRKKWYIYIVIFFVATLYTFAINMFVSVAKILPSGLSAIAFIPSIFSHNLTPFITGIYLILNIPLILIFRTKIKKTFLYRTLFFLIIQAAIGLLFFIPELNLYANHMIIGSLDINKEIWPIFLLSAIGATFVGFSVAYMWKLGGSTAGSDIIVYYYSTKKKLDVGFVAFLISIIFITISFTITMSFDSDSRKNYASKIIASILYVAINSMIMNILYPRYSKVWFEIHTTKNIEIEKFFSQYNHAYQIRKVTSG
ncbi:MAG: YitT family protein, partial [Mycoplasmataceae bacterium]|nr:YitT family protein [Mycoplasmataceae bacterium]